jgi:hypothetical protein
MLSTESKKALAASIRKYRYTVKLLEACYHKRIEVRFEEGGDEYYVSGKRIAYGIQDCPLCKLYYGFCCVGCCIAYDTGLSRCIETPYQKYEDTLLNSHSVTKRLIKAAKKELDYLVVLNDLLKKNG